MAAVLVLGKKAHMDGDVKCASPGNMILVLLCSLLPYTALAQSPSDLIRYLTYQSDRPDTHGMVKGEVISFTCGRALGEAHDDRALTNSIVNLGSAAVPALEDALDSFEKLGRDSEVAGKASWLMLAYAKIMGPAAGPRLRRTYADPKLAPYAAAIDGSIALASGFTSYLSAQNAEQVHELHLCPGGGSSVTLSRTPCAAGEREIPVRNFRCRRNEPRDSLNEVILAWLADSHVSLQASLGPGARAAFKDLSETDGWNAMEKQLQSAKSRRSIALGYRFNISGRWSEPEETIEEKAVEAVRLSNPDRIEIETSFYTSSGTRCGESRLAFARVPQPGWHIAGPFKGHVDQIQGPSEYLVDNSNITDLFRVMESCALSDD